MGPPLYPKQLPELELAALIIADILLLLFLLGLVRIWTRLQPLVDKIAPLLDKAGGFMTGQKMPTIGQAFALLVAKVASEIDVTKMFGGGKKP